MISGITEDKILDVKDSIWQYEYRLDFGGIMNFENSEFDKYVKVVMLLWNITK